MQPWPLPKPTLKHLQPSPGADCDINKVGFLETGCFLGGVETFSSIMAGNSKKIPMKWNCVDHKMDNIWKPLSIRMIRLESIV